MFSKLGRLTEAKGEGHLSRGKPPQEPSKTRFHMALLISHTNGNFSWTNKHLLLFYTKALSSSSFLLHNSMLKRLLHSPTLHRFFSHPTKFLSFPGRHPCACACAHFPSVSWPVSPIFPRPIHSLNVLAMAERPSAPASHSHKYTNRLAAEHSPYLLQHAHNPVSGVHLHLHFY
jgi:hypothetical protein